MLNTNCASFSGGLTNQRRLFKPSNYFGPSMRTLRRCLTARMELLSLTGVRLQKTSAWKPELSLQLLTQSCRLVRLDIDLVLALHTHLHWKGYDLGIPTHCSMWKMNPSETEFRTAHFHLVQLAWACHCSTWRPRRWPNYLQERDQQTN